MQEFGTVKSADVPSWFVEDIARLFTLYPQVKMTPITPVSWWTVLGGMTREQLRQSIAIAVEASPGFIPSAPAILCAGKKTIREPGLKLAAWQQVLMAAKNSRAHHGFDLRTAEVIEQMGGMIRLGQMTEEDLTVWGRKQFDQLWDETEQRDELRKRLGYVDESKKLGNCGNNGVNSIVGQLSEKLELVK